MGITDRVKDKYIARLDELIQAGQGIPMKQHSELRSDFITGESNYLHYKLASWPDLFEWPTSCIAVLEQVVPKSSLLRKKLEKFNILGKESSELEFAVSFLKSVKTEIQNGFLDNLALQIESEVLADYLAQAASILKGEKNEFAHIPAAVLAGASLEKTLKTLCDTLIPPEPVLNEKNAPLGMSALIDALKKREVFNEVQAEQLRFLAAIRNSAAHGNFQEFDRQQVKMMIEGVRRFISQYLK